MTKMIDSAQRPKIKRIARATAITTPTTASVLASALNTPVTVVQTGERSPTSSRLVRPRRDQPGERMGEQQTHTDKHHVDDRCGYDAAH